MYNSVCVVGLGYIGLPTALLMAKAGLTIYGYDVDHKRVSQLKKGILPFHEPGLDELFAKVQKKGTFAPVDVLPVADAYLIAVPTPHKKHTADLQYVLSALKNIQPIFPENGTIIIESTIGPRDCSEVLIPFIDTWSKKYIFAHCPERAIPGSTLQEMVKNDRVIGGRTRQEAKIVAEIYARFVTGAIFTTTATVAASVKVMENTYRATNIALANEFAQLATTLQFDVWEAISLANKHPRVTIHLPGPGVGGHCIPIDPWFFVQDAPQGIIQAALEKNASMPAYVFRQVQKYCKKHKLTNPVIGLLGYAYKKNVDDARETPTEKLYSLFSKKFETIIADPYCEQTLKRNALPVVSTSQLLKKATVIVSVTDHDEFKKIIFKNYPSLMFVYDTRNMFTSKNFANSSTDWYVLGRA